MTDKAIGKRLFVQSVKLMLVGILSGLTVGVIVTFYALAAEIIGEHSANIYEGIRQNPAFIPLLFLTLAAGAFMVGTLCYLVPMLSSNGVPQTEGASRGILKLKWYQILPSMAAASLVSIFMGLTAGSEGPCMLIGAMCGDGTSKLFKSTDIERRYQITGGACAGVAVAANAPLTGIVFALEEAHRRFTPSIFVCALSSVFTAVATRNLLYVALGLARTQSFLTFRLVHMHALEYLYVALAALVCAGVGVLIVKLVPLVRRLFARMTALRGIVRFLIPFMLAGVVGLISVYATGSGHSLINLLGTEGGTRGMELHGIFGSPIAVTLFVLVILRVIMLIAGIGAGVPCGVFIPILAIGALLGALMSRLFMVMGMSAIYADGIMLICMATLFTTTVKAPLTAFIFTMEFTWQPTMLLPVVLGVFIGYMLSEIARNKPLYDILLEEMVEKTHKDVIHHEYVTLIVEGAHAAGQTIRDVLWQDGVYIKSIERDGQNVLVTSDTVLLAGDRLTLQADIDDIEEFETRVEEIVKPQLSRQPFKVSKRVKSLIDEKIKDKAPLEDDPRQGEDSLIKQTEENAVLQDAADDDICAIKEVANGQEIASDDERVEERADEEPSPAQEVNSLDKNGEQTD